MVAHRVRASCSTRTPASTDPADTHPDDMAFWLFSGGSTGFPKGVVHLHHDIPYTCETFAQEILQITEGDVTFSSTKLYHAYGLGNNLTFPYWVGATTVLRTGQARPARPAGDRPGSTGRACSSASPRSTARWSTCPTRATTTCQQRPHLRLRRRAARPRGLAPLAGRVRPRHRRRHRLDRDAAHLLLQPPGRRPARARAASRCRATSSCCSTSSASPCADGEVGNLHVRGDSALAYYWHQHEKTKAAIKGDWFFTGDRYRENDDG